VEASDDLAVLWRRPQPTPEPPIEREEVMEIFWALARIHANTRRILTILGEDADEEEED
jgi:hypothetical protein